MRVVLMMGCCLYIWALTIVQCSSSSSQCRPVAMNHDVVLDCNQDTSSTERFILWYYSNSSKSGYESAASCYFENACNVTDHSQYVIRNMSENTLARTTLAIKKVTAEHNGWTYQCYVWDASKDIMYLSKEYRLLVYKAPKETLNCSYRMDKPDAVTVKCQIDRVFPQTISCRLQCESGENQNLNVTVQPPSATQYKIICEGSISASFQGNQCKVTVLARDDEGICEYVLATANDSFAFPGKSKQSILHQEDHVPQSESQTNVYFSYMFSGVVAAVVIPLSICTLFVVLRKKRRRRIPSIQFPEYVQTTASQELVSANSTNSWGSTFSGSGEVASGVYHNTASMDGDTKSNHSPDAPVTLPFLAAEGDTVNEFSIGELAEFVPLPAPHRQHQMVMVNRVVKENKCRCYKPRQLIEMSERKPINGIAKHGRRWENTQVKNIKGETSLSETCQCLQTVIPEDSQTTGCDHRNVHAIHRRELGSGSIGYNLHPLRGVSERRQRNLQCSRTNSGKDDGLCALPADYVCNRGCLIRCEPNVPCRGCHRTDHSTTCESRENQRRRPCNRNLDDEPVHRNRPRPLGKDDVIGQDLLIDCTEHPDRCDCLLNYDIDHQKLYIDPCSSGTNSAKSSIRQANGEQPSRCDCCVQTGNDHLKLYIDPCSSGATSSTSSSRQTSTHSCDESCEVDDQSALLEQTNST